MQNPTMPRPFHVAFPVQDLSATRVFYEAVLGCAVGRTDSRWIDFNLFGHQVTAHLVDDAPGVMGTNATNLVGSKAVPTQHWGVILEMDEWEALAERLRSHGVAFIIEPYTRFKGEVGEQATMFFLDPSSNALEFKAFADDAAIFATS
ncbi:VOC family protein [Thermoleptolyngbya sichuanensis]